MKNGIVCLLAFDSKTDSKYACYFVAFPVREQKTKWETKCYNRRSSLSSTVNGQDTSGKEVMTRSCLQDLTTDTLLNLSPPKTGFEKGACGGL